MKKLFPLFFLLLASVPAFAGDYVFKQPNNQANYVRLESLKEKEVKELGVTMPYTISEEKMIDILRSLRYSRKAVFTDKEKIRNVYEMEYIDKYAPYIVQALAQAKPNQIVAWSIAQKRPLVILRNDRLTQMRMWVAGNELHMDFIKTEAYLQGDYQAHNMQATRLIENSKGLRIVLEPQQGQKFGLSSTEELVLDLNADWARISDQLAAEDERIEAEEKSKKNKKRTAREAKADTDAPAPVSSTPAYVQPSAKDQKNAQARLQELKSLEEKGLISKEDYNKKKEEILQGM